MFGIEQQTFDVLVYAWMGFALFTLPFLLRITAPYGRHVSSKWGPLISNTAGWIIMEWTVPLVFLIFFLGGENRHSTVNWVLCSLWMLHYINRSVIYPFRQKSRGKQIPLLMVFFGVFYNFMNAFFVGHYLGTMRPPYAAQWLWDPRFVCGCLLFFGGLSINWWSDNILLNLRRPGETGYRIPRGGFFRFVSCPNHFGEIVEWSGFALMIWGLPAVAFALWTVTNLLPRARDHHRWYVEQFADYPARRKAVIPFVL
ncbi:MAG: 3-oxo-5-alpha-steroid 4-dehydrogenase [Deltaproteobacteria bacterium]|nr:3-oxo-5-alpha-steroid 4-dehydrogenase [Deltaproteobacteria bacterium]